MILVLGAHPTSGPSGSAWCIASGSCWVSAPQGQNIAASQWLRLSKFQAVTTQIKDSSAADRARDIGFSHIRHVRPQFWLLLALSFRSFLVGLSFTGCGSAPASTSRHRCVSGRTLSVTSAVAPRELCAAGGRWVYTSVGELELEALGIPFASVRRPATTSRCSPSTVLRSSSSILARHSAVCPCARMPLRSVLHPGHPGRAGDRAHVVLPWVQLPPLACVQDGPRARRARC